MVRNSASPITRTPSEFAFVSFEPASAPAITADVFFDTLDDTFPPRAFISAEASSRVIEESVPVRTNVMPSKSCDTFSDFEPSVTTPAASSASISAAEDGSEKNAAALSAVISPISGTAAMSSALAEAIARIDPN